MKHSAQKLFVTDSRLREHARPDGFKQRLATGCPLSVSSASMVGCGSDRIPRAPDASVVIRVALWLTSNVPLDAYAA